MQAMETTPVYNSPRPVIYIYAQDCHQYVSDQMEVRVTQSLSDKIKVIVNRAVTSALEDLRVTLDLHKDVHHQEVCT